MSVRRKMQGREETRRREEDVCDMCTCRRIWMQMRKANDLIKKMDKRQDRRRPTRGPEAHDRTFSLIHRDERARVTAILSYTPEPANISKTDGIKGWRGCGSPNS